MKQGIYKYFLDGLLRIDLKSLDLWIMLSYRLSLSVEPIDKQQRNTQKQPH